MLQHKHGPEGHKYLHIGYTGFVSEVTAFQTPETKDLPSVYGRIPLPASRLHGSLRVVLSLVADVTAAHHQQDCCVRQVEATCPTPVTACLDTGTGAEVELSSTTGILLQDSRVTLQRISKA